MTSAAAIPSVTLNDDHTMPVIGLGVGELSDAETESAVSAALEAGYRLIDTAAAYGNEAAVGRAIASSGVPRDELFVTTKLATKDQGFQSSQDALAASLERLGLDYVDLYLIHWPLPLANARIWRQLEALLEGGQARAIGVSNFGRDRLAKLVDSNARTPAVNQVQFSPYHYRRRLLEYCLEHEVVFEAYSPLARGQGVNDLAITAVAARLGRTPAQVMLRWAIQHQAVVIPKSSHEERIRSNARVFDFELTDANMQTLDALDRTSGAANARG